MIARWADHLRWAPFLHGTDGLTGRQRRAYVRRYMAGVGNRSRPAPTKESR